MALRKYAVIVAGGSGTRMGGGIPKQFRSLNGRPVLWWSMKAFSDADPHTRIILVLPDDFISLWTDFYSTLPECDRFAYEVCSGGKTRSESVKNGLALIPDEDSMVAVHDGARPLVSPEIITRGWKTCQDSGAAIPVIGITDSLRRLQDAGSQSVDRNEYVAVQTPQVFKTQILKEAYEKARDGVFTDDASVVEACGKKVALFEGSPVNIKITNPKDLEIATVLTGKGS